MGVFDLKAFMNVAGGGGSLTESLGTAFGVPSCMINLASDVLNLLPSPVLLGMRETMLTGTSLADEVVKGVFSKLFGWLGIIEWDTEEGGFVFISNASKQGNDSGGLLDDIGSFLDAVNQVANFGARLYQNYLIAAQQIQSIIDCIGSFRDYLKFKDGNAGDTLKLQDPQAYEDYINGAYAIEKRQVEDALKFISDCNTQIKAIDDILNNRIENPDLEPIFSPEYCSILSGTTGFVLSCDPQVQPQKEIFRLVYGPPKSTFGQFILSQDGLYFDSQSSGIYPALSHVNTKGVNYPLADRWKFYQDPNIGGRGKGFSTNDLKLYVNTILDPDTINESTYIQEYYNKDGFLQELIGTKNKRIYDLSAQLNDLILDDAPISVINNFRQSIISETALFTQKINKRKKQIELAVVLPFGGNTVYRPGQVPVNDFSYLAGLNISIDIQKQKALSFSQADISGVVSPIQLQTTYVLPKVHTKNSNLDHLIVAENGTGAIIYDGSSVSSTDAVILEAENSLVTDGLFAMYNFLDTDVQDPSSTVFNSRNSASITDQYYAQLVAPHASSLFNNGLAIPYFHGITRHSESNPTAPSGLGSFLKLPSAKPFNDLLYSNTGATIDFWVHAPNLESISTGYDVGSVSGLYRLVLSNENVGINGTATETDTEYISNKLNGSVVRGFMMGFTRDRRIVSGLPGSNINDDNPATDSVFFLAPTQSVTASSAGLINRSLFDGGGCNTATKYHSMIVPLNKTVDGVALSSCQYNFCHISVTFNPKEDELCCYVDGVKMATSSISDVFGIEKYRMPELPTFKVTNSFEYNSTTVGALAPNSLKFGPKLDDFFTPWIVGGGYTDGLYNKGNFMGGTYGGLISGLKGYLGSLKFYSKPLTPSQVLNNYKTQKNFFKNIDTLALGWEDIVSL